MRVAVNGAFLAKPFSGIGRYACELGLALDAGAAECRFVTASSVSRAYDHYVSQLTITGRLPMADIYWGPAHRLPLSLPKDLPTVVTVHDLVWKRHPETMRWRTFLGEKFLFTAAVKRADRIICISQSTADDMALFFPSLSEKIRVVRPGVHAANADAEKSKKAFALFVGTFEPRKNIERIIAAYGALPKAVRDACHLVLAGRSGWGGIDVHASIKKYGLDDYVAIQHAPDDMELQELYASCRFLVMPSLYEGFGLPIIEAAAHGKPCITSNVSSMPEIAGEAGILVNPLQETEISAAMTKLINDTEFRTELSAVAKKSVARFSWSLAAKEMLEVFGEVM